VSAFLGAGLLVGVVAGIVVTPGLRSGGASTTATLKDSAVTSYTAGVTDALGLSASAGPTTAGSRVVAASLAVSGGTQSAYVAVPTTETQVAADLLVAVDTQSHGSYTIGATTANISLMVAWMNNEGGLWADNPLNTSLDSANYPHQFTTAGQDTGIPIFPTIQTGIDATATTLLSNNAYTPILTVLNGGTGSCVAFARAVIQSPWAASHYGSDTSRFCGSTGASVTVPVVTTACLRLSGGARHGSHRMPGTCGRRAATARARVARGQARATARGHRPEAQSRASRHVRAAGNAPGQGAMPRPSGSGRHHR